MSFIRTRSDGKEVEIISIDRAITDYYQWGKNCANLEQTEEEIRKVLVSYGDDFSAEDSDNFWRGFTDNKIQSTIEENTMNNQTNATVGAQAAQSIIANVGDITRQLHGSAKSFKHHANLFQQFAAQDLPFMLLKVMAVPRRSCTVPAQAAFFATKEELLAASTRYRTQLVQENGLDVLYVDMFEWDLGINYIQPVTLN